MEAMPSALVKDLLSTGYFYEELRNYTDSKEIDLFSYSMNYAVPYLTKIVNSYSNLGQHDRTEILLLAINKLKESHDEDLVESILGLKKITSSEIDSNEKSLHQISQDDKPGLRTCRRKSESAQALAKLLVSIIKMFKLAEGIANRKRGQAAGNEIMETSEFATPPG
ncbi:MAG: hypothetical protein AB9873_20650 [Syntrophobacteraceae bacterium]